MKLPAGWDAGEAAAYRQRQQVVCPTQGAEELPWDWDAAEVAAYWRRRPVAVATRTAQVLSAAAAIGASLGSDYAFGRLQRNARRRAAQVRAPACHES